MNRRGMRAAVAGALVLATSAAAGEVQDRIFEVGLLKEVATGQTLVYDRTRSGSLMSEAVPAIDRGAIEVAVVESDDGRAARIELRTGDQPTSRSMVPADGGHPVMLVFLETSARSMAELTGGSPFYIRNRMREALGAEVPLEPMELSLDGEQVPAQSATFQPFRDDPNRAQMGAFADLEITMVLSDAVPGGFARFEAVAGPDAAGSPAYSDTIAYAATEDE